MQMSLVYNDKILQYQQFNSKLMKSKYTFYDLWHFWRFKNLYIYVSFSKINDYFLDSTSEFLFKMRMLHFLLAFSLAINGIICCCKYIWYKVAVDFQDLFLMSNSICTVSLNIVNIIVSSIKTANCCFYCLAV